MLCALFLSQDMTCDGVVTFWIFLLLSLILHNADLTNGGRPDELHIGGIFPIAGTGGWQGGQACMPAARLALDDVNREPNLLPGFKLILHSNDSEVSVGKFSFKSEFGVKILIKIKKKNALKFPNISLGIKCLGKSY